MGVSDLAIDSITRNPPYGDYIVLTWTCDDASSVTLYFGPSAATAGDLEGGLPEDWLNSSCCTDCGNLGFNLPVDWKDGGATVYAFLYVTGGVSAGTSNVATGHTYDNPISDLEVELNALPEQPDYVELTWTLNAEADSVVSLYYCYSTTNPGDLSAATFQDLVSAGFSMNSIPTDWTNAGFNLGYDFITNTTYYFVLCSRFDDADECSNVASGFMPRGWNPWLMPPVKKMKKRKR